MDTLLARAFAFVTGILLLAGASLMTLAIPAAKTWAAEPAAPVPTDGDRQHMMQPPGSMMGMDPGMMMGQPGMMPGSMMGGMGGGMMCPMCANAGMMSGMMTDDLSMLGMLGLTEAQRDKIEKLQDEQRRQDGDTLGKFIDEQIKLRALFQTDPVDLKKISAVYGNIGRLQAQRMETQAEHRNRVMAVLTKEQKERLKRWQGGEPGMGMMSPSGMMAR